MNFHEAAEQDPSLEAEARNWFRKLEDSDPDALAMWKRFMRFSLVEFERIYGSLDIHFDLVQGESFYQDKMKEVESLLREKWIARSERSGAGCIPRGRGYAALSHPEIRWRIHLCDA